MPTLYHPFIADNSREVEDDMLKKWLKQGWLLTAPAPVVAPSEPPRAGPGSGKQAWVAYAEGLGFEIAAEDTRDAIIAKVDAGPARPVPAESPES